MRVLLTALLLASVALSLSACLGYQKGNGFSKFDTKSFWESDDASEGGSDSGAAPDSPDHGGGGTSDSGSN